MSSRKRKHARRGSPDYNAGGETDFTQSSSPMTLCIQAHEATIVRGQPDLAQALTTRDNGSGKGGLIQWHGDESKREQEIWVDRYDARLLLSTPPPATPQNDAPAAPPSPTGWSDLPSDSEDTFFFSPGEIEDIRREKRRKVMDAGREKRLRAMRDFDPDPIPEIADVRESWGGDDEEPEEAQRTLMERTAKHLLTSPNPGQLEMRILANHGSDQRFAFLKGRWRNAWRAIKVVTRAEKESVEKQSDVAETSGGALVAYDSDTSDVGQDDPPDSGGTNAVALERAEEKVKEARRARAMEWIRQRKVDTVDRG